jgi:replication factor A1
MADAARSQITRGALKYISTIPKKAILLIPSSAIFNDPDRLQRDFPVPICQCVQIKSLTTTTEGQPERYRLVLSDIDHYVQSMLATRKFPRRILGYRVKQVLRGKSRRA